MNNEFSIESLYSEGIGLTKVSKPSYSYSEEDLFDGDFDSLNKEIESGESLLDFYDTYQAMTEYNTTQKLKMLKKLKNITRGNTSYHASLESFIEKEMSMEDGEPAENDDAKPADKPTTPNTDAKQKWYVTIWEKIKFIFKKIMKWIRKRIAAIVDFFRNGKGAEITQEQVEEVDEIAVECAKSDPKTFDEICGNLSQVYGETNSKQGSVYLSEQLPPALDRSINSYSKLCEKFKLVTEKIKAYGELKPEAVGAINEIMGVAKQITGFENDAKLDSVNVESLKKFNSVVKWASGVVDYEKDPVKYYKLFANATFTEDPKSNYLKTLIENKGKKAQKGWLENEYNFCKKLIEELNKLKTPLSNSDRYLEEANKTFVAYLNSTKKVKIDNNGDINSVNNEKDENKNDIKSDVNQAIIETYGVTTSIYRLLLKISNIVGKIINLIVTTATADMKMINDIKNAIINRKLWTKFKKGGASVLAKLGEAKDKVGKGLSTASDKVGKGIGTFTGNVASSFQKNYVPREGWEKETVDKEREEMEKRERRKYEQAYGDNS